ncbi:MAG TPA: CDP-alcohol phosphatidyltransferase family protein [Chlamydiales bacterium]|nr:CDP-alcohol phosphatidyltransferase family protein [Chlamydiales bacterium]
MISVSNGLSFLRIPLAFVFLSESVTLRCFAILIAMFTDSVDGYIARKNQSVSRFGAFLDPVADKFFVYFALLVLFFEGKIQLLQMFAMISRDIVIFGYGVLIVLTRGARSIIFRSLRAGKVATALQFCVLFGLVLQVTFSWLAFSAFIAVGVLAFLELFNPPKHLIFHDR